MTYEHMYYDDELKWVVRDDEGDLVAARINSEEMARKITCIPLLLEAVEAGIDVMEDAPLDPQVVEAVEKMKKARDSAKGEDNG